MPTVAVGLIRSPGFGSGLIERGDADIVAIAREALVDPNWTNRAASRSGANDGWDHWPVQFAMWLKAREATLQRAARDA
jgi:2,4-dienoyl-CoA reductase-like NADH-dependent reductase (Old Yellow Enzyme family)